MFSLRRFLPILALAVFALLTACGNRDPQPPVPPRTVDDRFPIKIGSRVVQMQVALRPAETEKGLMFRKTMGEEEGMLFVYNRPQPMSYWMRNTELPLDIGYIDGAGVLQEVYPMYPHDEAPVVSRGHRQFALEMNQGWFNRAGVKPGDRLDLRAVVEAVRARGLKPADFGLRDP